MNEKFVVRLWDGMDGYWIDVSEPISQEAANKLLATKTGNGTRNTKYSDIDYYCIFPAGTKMIFSADMFDEKS